MLENINRIEFDYDKDLVVLQSRATTEMAKLIKAIELKINSATDHAFRELPRFEGWDWRSNRTATADARRTVLLLCEPGVSEYAIVTTSEFRVRLQITSPVVGPTRLELAFAHRDPELEQAVVDALVRLAA